MKTNKKNNRRQFLKNTSLVALSLGILPKIATAEPKKITDDICDKTTLDYYGEGPFYTENPPDIQDGQLVSKDAVGTRLILSGRVYNLDCAEFIPNTIIDIWHADDAGDYDNEGYNFRGKTTTNSEGFFLFETIYPGKYLNGSKYRPAHIHFKITPPGFDTLITQLYFEGDVDIEGDAAASITSGQFDASDRVVPLTTNSEGKLEGTWDIVINGTGTTVGIPNIHIDKGMIYNVLPNPFSDTLVIKYGIFRPAKVSLLVYDIQGKQVATLQEQTLQTDKYEAVWQVDSNLPNGHYFVALKINDLQVHYLKIFKQNL